MRSSKETVPLYTLTLILTHEYVGWSNDTFDLYIGVVKAWYFEKYVRSYCVKLSGIIWYIRSVLHILCKIASMKSARAQALAVFGYFGCFHKTRHLPTRPRFVQLAARAQMHTLFPLLPNMGLNQTYTSSCNAWGKCYIWKDSDFEETKAHPQIWSISSNPLFKGIKSSQVRKLKQHLPATHGEEREIGSHGEDHDHDHGEDHTEK